MRRTCSVPRPCANVSYLGEAAVSPRAPAVRVCKLRTRSAILDHNQRTCTRSYPGKTRRISGRSLALLGHKENTREPRLLGTGKGPAVRWTSIRINLKDIACNDHKRHRTRGQDADIRRAIIIKYTGRKRKNRGEAILAN